MADKTDSVADKTDSVAELIVQNGPDSRSSLNAKFQITNSTRPQSVTTTSNVIWILYTARASSRTVLQMELTSGFTKSYDRNVTNSVFTSNGARGVMAEKIRSLLHVQGSSLRENRQRSFAASLQSVPQSARHGCCQWAKPAVGAGFFDALRRRHLQHHVDGHRRVISTTTDPAMGNRLYRSKKPCKDQVSRKKSKSLSSKQNRTHWVGVIVSWEDGHRAKPPNPS